MNEQNASMVQRPQHKCTSCGALLLIAGRYPRLEFRESEYHEYYLAVQCHNCNTKMVPEKI